MADPRAPRTGPRTSYNPSVKHVEEVTWHLASISDANVHRSWTFRGDLNDEVLSLPTGAGIPLEERFLFVPKYNVLAVIMPEAARGASKHLRLFDLGEPLSGVDVANEEQAGTGEVPAPDEPLFRKWTDSTGKYTLEASVVAVKRGYVKLEKRDGSTVVLPISKLSVADQEWLRENAE